MNKNDQPEIKKGDCVQLKETEQKMTVENVSPRGIQCLHRDFREGAVQHPTPYPRQALELVDSRDESDNRSLKEGERVHLPSDHEGLDNCPMLVVNTNDEKITACWSGPKGKQVCMEIPHGVLWRGELKRHHPAPIFVQMSD